MGQFDVYENPITKGRAVYPYVCCLQSELLDGLSTRVIGFITDDESFSFDRVSVPVPIKGKDCFLCMNVVATIESHRLSRWVTNINASRNQIINACGTLLMGI